MLVTIIADRTVEKQGRTAIDPERARYLNLVETIPQGISAIPCGIIVNELLANSLKHAFPGERAGAIKVEFREADGLYTLVFRDNGIGFPNGLDISEPSSLGLTIVNALTGQLRGKMALDSADGCEIKITFPKEQSAR